MNRYHKERGPGYHVYVKSRQYYKGKPKGDERFRRLTSKSFTYSDAMSLLGSALDNSIAQTGYIKPSGKPAKGLHKSVPSKWDNISFKFDKKADKYMERRAYAIDTRGESQDLNVFHWYKKLPVKKQRSRQQTVVDYPSMGVDMYGFERMSNRMNKMFRGFRYG